MKYTLKRTIGILLAVIFVVAAVSCISVAAVPDSIYTNYGDVNEDGIINVRDVSYIQKVLAGDEAEYDSFYDAANVYLDNNIDIRDVTTLQKYLAGIYTSLPINPAATTPTTATTPTEDPSRPTVDPLSTDPDGWYNHIIKP